MDLRACGRKPANGPLWAFANAGRPSLRRLAPTDVDRGGAYGHRARARSRISVAGNTLLRFRCLLCPHHRVQRLEGRDEGGCHWKIARIMHELHMAVHEQHFAAAIGRR